MSTERTQSSSRVLLIRPTGFRRDDEAAESNWYMKESSLTGVEIQSRAAEEFDRLVDSLQAAGVQTLVLDDPLALPDAVFPNNWVSFHQPIVEGSRQNPMIVTYPMRPFERRKERREDVLDAIAKFTQCEPDHLDFTALELDEEILEGTGSLVLDRVGNIAYACLSDRCTEDALDAWADETGYAVVRFHAADQNGNPIYHTNVMMSLGTKLAVVCLESVTDPDEYDLLEYSIKSSGRILIRISQEQVNHFCGNILELQTQSGEPVFAMSKTAFDHFTPEHIAQIERLGQVVAVDIPTIEQVGGGSVRCMIAELGVPG